MTSSIRTLRGSSRPTPKAIDARRIESWVLYIEQNSIEDMEPRMIAKMRRELASVTDKRIIGEKFLFNTGDKYSLYDMFMDHVTSPPANPYKKFNPFSARNETELDPDRLTPSFLSNATALVEMFKSINFPCSAYDPGHEDFMEKEIKRLYANMNAYLNNPYGYSAEGANKMRKYKNIIEQAYGICYAGHVANRIKQSSVFKNYMHSTIAPITEHPSRFSESKFNYILSSENPRRMPRTYSSSMMFGGSKSKSKTKKRTSKPKKRLSKPKPKKRKSVVKPKKIKSKPKPKPKPKSTKRK